MVLGGTDEIPEDVSRIQVEQGGVYTVLAVKVTITYKVFSNHQCIESGSESKSSLIHIILGLPYPDMDH